MEIRGFKVGGSDKSIHFVAAVDAKTVGIRGLHLPLSKITWIESDDKSIEITTKESGVKIGFPGTVTIDNEFAAKIKLI